MRLKDVNIFEKLKSTFFFSELSFSTEGTLTSAYILTSRERDFRED